MEKPVSFKNRNDQTLFGILHIPQNVSSSKKRIGVNLLNPGLKNRVAPNRLNVKIARVLCEKGFYVFRFDPSGIGDSEGQLTMNNEVLFTLWSMVQKGIFVDDTTFSNSFFIEVAKLDQLFLIGQCGAGTTALLCGGKDTRVDGLILIDTPFRLVSPKSDMSDIIEEYNEPDKVLLDSFKYLFMREKLKKLITFNINWPLYINILCTLLKNAFHKKSSNEIDTISDRFHWEMARQFQAFIKRNKPICFLFAENDFTLKDFTQDFKPHFLDGKVDHKKYCQFHIIKNANHIYTEIAWQNELINTIDQWFSLRIKV